MKKKTTKKKASKTRTTNKVFKKALAIARADKPFSKKIRCVDGDVITVESSPDLKCVQLNADKNRQRGSFFAIPMNGRDVRTLTTTLNKAQSFIDNARAAKSRHRAGSRATAELLAAERAPKPKRVRLSNKRVQELSRTIAQRGCCGDTICNTPLAPLVTDSSASDQDGAS